MKAKNETDSTPRAESAPESRDRAPSDHPPPPAKLPSWRPTVPGVQPRPTLHGVQPLITLRGLSAPTEHDLPIQRDTPPEVVEAPFEVPPISAHRVPADLERYLSGGEVSDVGPASPPNRGLIVPRWSTSDSSPSSTRERFERRERVRR